MTLVRSVALSLLIAACVTPGAPSPTAPSLGPASYTPLPPVTGDPVDLNAPPEEFWRLGQAACPEGATFTPSTPPYFQAYCGADGKIDGPSATFDAEGHLLTLERYVHGEAEGLHRAYWPNGRPRQEQAWHAGKPHGPFTSWYEDGQKAETGAYRDARLDGTILAWDGHGKPLPASTLQLGTGTYSEWHPSGDKARERTFIDGLEHGLRREWHPNGNKAVEAQVDHGVLHGMFAAWDLEGRPLRSGSFANNTEVGDWTFYAPGGRAIERVDTYANGEIVASITYQDGKPLGKPAADLQCKTSAGLASAFKAGTGQVLDDGDTHCVRRAVHFPGVVAIGAFASDRGCGPNGVIVDCVYHERLAGTPILARAGWKRASPAAREQIARHYVAEVGLVWNAAGEPSLTRAANGDLLVTGTVTIVGMSGSSSHSQTFRFTPAGEVMTLKER